MVAGGTWSSSNAAVASVGSTGSVDALTAGTATITYSVTNGCGTTIALHTVTVSACTTEVNTNAATATELTIAPNPNSGSFTLHISSLQNENVPVTIVNMLGERVKEFTAATNADVAVKMDVAPGVYFVSAATSEGVLNVKVVVE